MQVKDKAMGLPLLFQSSFLVVYQEPGPIVTIFAREKENKKQTTNITLGQKGSLLCSVILNIMYYLIEVEEVLLYLL